VLFNCSSVVVLGDQELISYISSWVVKVDRVNILLGDKVFIKAEILLRWVKG